jgi:NAD(P)-dependent dehydrogenase (short-subunit alcohol dehydrogenase family)
MEAQSMTTQTPRVAVITGASSGIGKATAVALARQGWRVIGVGRDAARSMAAEAEIRTASSSGQVDMLRADLSLLAEAARTACDIAALSDRVDVLVNNAGGMSRQKTITAEGNEANFASNHLGPFLLTMRLLPLLQRTAATAPRGSVRILNTASDASEMVPGMDWDDFQTMEKFHPGLAYCRGKLANVMFARALGLRLAEHGIIAHAMHPGAVDSNFASHADEQSQATMRSHKQLTPEEGADTLIWLATAEEPGATTGGYYYQRALRPPHASVNDNASLDRLWEETEKIIAGAGL